MNRIALRVGHLTAPLALLALVLALPACKKDAATPAADKTAPAPADDKAAPPAVAPAPAPTPGVAGDKLQLPNQPPKVGTVVVAVDSMEMNMDIDAKGQKMVMTQSKLEKSTGEVLATSADAMTKIKVTYAERSEKQVMNGQEKSKPDPLAGHTYVVERKDSKLIAEREGGKISPDETAALERDWKSLGTPDKMSKLMSSRAFAVGERVTLSGEEMKALMEEENDKNTVSEAAITLTGIAGGKATFALEMTFAVNEGPKLVIPLKGTVVIDVANGHPHEFRLEGPIKGSAEGVSFEGTMKASKTFDYK